VLRRAPVLTRAAAKWWVLGGVVFAVAVAGRLGVTLTGAGLSGNVGYDPSVYYAAAEALSHGHVPYRGDFVLVHPPLIAVLGLPFAILGRLTTDQVGYAAANCATCFVGAVNAVLVMVVARRWQLPRSAALAGALAYAVWLPAVQSEFAFRLEPFGNLLLLLGLWTLGDGRDASTRRLVLCGICFGLLVNVKLWWTGSVAVLLIAVALTQRNRRVAAIPVLALAGTALVIDLPLLALSHGRMIRSVLSAQLSRPAVQGVPGRGYEHLPISDRLQTMTGVGDLANIFRSPAEVPFLAEVRWATALACVLVVALCVVACRTVAGRIFVALLAAHVVILFAAPVYFSFYAGFLAVPLALVVACSIAAARRAAPRLLTVPAAAWLAAGVAGIVAMYSTGGPDVVTPLPDRATVAATTARLRCIQTDLPWVLIAVDALDRSFANGCKNFVDFQGVGHGAGPNPDAYVDVLYASPAYQRQVARYLRSGDAVVVHSGYPMAFLTRKALRSLESGPLIARAGTIEIFRTPHTH
jgi:alpha-1,2-mannosyltransferase